MCCQIDTNLILSSYVTPPTSPPPPLHGSASTAHAPMAHPTAFLHGTGSMHTTVANRCLDTGSEGLSLALRPSGN